MPSDVRGQADPWRCCPRCPDGRLRRGQKHIDQAKPAWRWFDCGHYVDDRARADALATPDLHQRYTDALLSLLGSKVLGP